MEMAIRTIGQDMVMQLDGYVAARIVQSKEITATATVTATASIDIPKNWWEHFKFDLLNGSWFIKKFPIKWITKQDVQNKTVTKTETFEIKECAPNIIMRDDQQRVYLATFGPDNHGRKV